MMAAFAIVPPDGHRRTLDAITANGEIVQRSRFAPIIQGLMDKSNGQLRVSNSADRTGVHSELRSTAALMTHNSIDSSRDHKNYVSC